MIELQPFWIKTRHVKLKRRNMTVLQYKKRRNGKEDCTNAALCRKRQVQYNLFLVELVFPIDDRFSQPQSGKPKDLMVVCVGLECGQITVEIIFSFVETC